MANLYVTEKVNSVIVSDDKINVTVNEVQNNVTISSVGIQGAKGEAAYPTPLEANKLLTNNGAKVYWTDSLIETSVNGGSF